MTSVVPRPTLALGLAAALGGCSHDWGPWEFPGSGTTSGGPPVGGCPQGMALSPPDASGVCLDLAEATYAAFRDWRLEAPSACSAGQVDAPANDLLPATFVSECEARAFCESGGRRLCTPVEWRQACNRTAVDPAASCNVGATTFAKKPASPTCVNADGVRDLIGNVWEWACDGASCVVLGGDAAQQAADATTLCGLVDETFASVTGEADYVGVRCCADPLPPD